MKRKGNFVRKILYRSLSFENYLFVLSKLYFLSFNLGLLKNIPQYQYPYFLKHIVKPGDVVIDMGANLGYLTRLFSKLVKQEGKVYAVEPVEPILGVLRKNTKKCNNVKICPFALGNENKKIALGNDSIMEKGFVSSGTNYIIDGNITRNDEADIEFHAEMRKGSEYFSHLTRLDFMKIDVEGYETVILPEMESLITKFKPMILLESHSGKRKEMLQFMGNKGFRAFVLHQHMLYPTDENEFWDILFVHKAKMDRISAFIADQK